MNKRDVQGFIIQLTSVLVLAFGLHIFIIKSFQSTPFGHLIIEAYAFNYIFALLCFLALNLGQKKYAERLGFVFLVLSGLKFLFFFLLFYPSYKSDGVLEHMEFFNFFVPYSVSLTVEVYNIVRGLNRI